MAVELFPFLTHFSLTKQFIMSYKETLYFPHNLELEISWSLKKMKDNVLNLLFSLSTMKKLR